MVDFTLTDEQKALREMAHDFAEKEMRPVAWEYDKDGTWPEEVLRKAWELGLMNSHVEEQQDSSQHQQPIPDRLQALGRRQTFPAKN